MPAAPAAKLVQADDGDLVEHAEPRALGAAPIENMTRLSRCPDLRENLGLLQHDLCRALLFIRRIPVLAAFCSVTCGVALLVCRF
jgi:hypothetical protein